MPRQLKDGSTPGEKRDNGSLLSLFPNPLQENTGAWSWGQLRPGLLAEAFDAVNGGGDAMSLAMNRARTAGSVTLLTGGDRPRRWLNTYDEAEDFLDALIYEYKSRKMP